MADTRQLSDDKSISNDAWLLRRIHPSAHLVASQTEPGRRRLSSAAFHDSKDGTGTSFYVASEITKLRGSETKVLDGYPDHFLVRIKAGRLRELGMKLVRKAGDNTGHIYVEGKKKRKVCSAIRDSCEWVVKPTDLEDKL